MNTLKVIAFAVICLLMIPVLAKGLGYLSDIIDPDEPTDEAPPQ